MKTIAKAKGLELRAQTRNEGNEEAIKGELYIYGDIVSEEWFESDVSASGFVAALGSLDADSLDVFINSGGGSVFDGVAIYTALSRHKAHVSVTVDGLAASIASVIAMAGDKVTMAENATMMIHDPWTVAVGNSSDMRKQADVLDIVKDSMIGAYKRSSLSEQEIRDAMTAETWYTAESAVAAGFADGLSAPNKMAASIKVPKDLFQHTPKEFIQKQEGITMPDKTES